MTAQKVPFYQVNICYTLKADKQQLVLEFGLANRTAITKRIEREIMLKEKLRGLANLFGL